MIAFAWPSSFEQIVLTILAVVVLIIFGWSVYAFVASIFQFIFSRGEPDKIKTAWNNIRFMIIWLILTIVLLFIFPLVFRLFEVEWYQVYTAKNIFNKAGDIIVSLSSLTRNIRTGYEQSPRYDWRLERLQDINLWSSDLEL